MKRNLIILTLAIYALHGTAVAADTRDREADMRFGIGASTTFQGVPPRGPGANMQGSGKIELHGEPERGRMSTTSDDRPGMERGRDDDRRMGTTSTTSPMRKNGEPVGQMVRSIQKELRGKLASMIARYSATIERLLNISGRLETRIAKIKSDGQDTTVAEKFLASAKTDIAAAQTQMDTLKLNASTTLAADLTASSTVKTALNNLQTITSSIEKRLRSAQNSLEKAVDSLKKQKKEDRRDDKIKATSTSEIEVHN